MMPAIAAVIPTYNPGSYLFETLRSLERQTLAPAEVVVVDDGSDPEVVLPATGRLPIRVLRLPHAGISAARNAGVRVTSAPLVHVCDHDDLVEPRFYERLSEALDRADAAVAYTNCGFIDAEGRDLSGRLPATAPHHLTGPEALDRLLGWNSLASIATVFHRRLFDRLGGFRDLRFVQDWDFWIRAAAAGAHFRFVPELLAWHRMHPAQQSSEARRAEALAESIEMLARAEVPRRDRRSRARGLATLRLEAARLEAREGRPGSARRQVLRAALASPSAVARAVARARLPQRLPAGAAP